MCIIRDFCIACGTPIDRTTGQKNCGCSTEDLEQRERRHLAEYDLALYLEANHFDRFVENQARRIRVWDLVAEHHPADVIRELPFKVSEDGLLHLVYSRTQGTCLFKWPWVRG